MTTKQRNKKIFFFARIILTIGIIAFIIYKIDLAKIVSAFQQANVWLLTVASILIIAHVLIKSIKWHLLVTKIDNSNTFFDSVSSYLYGSSLSLVTPAKTGELGRVINLKGDKLKLGSLTIADKIFELIVVLCFAFIFSSSLLNNNFVKIIAVIGTISFFVVLFIVQKKRDLIERKVKLKIVSKILDSLSLLTPAIQLKVILLSIAVMLIYFMQAFFVVSAFHSVTPLNILTVFPLILLTNILPFTVGGLGVRESAAAVLLAAFGVPAEAAVSSTLLLLVFDTLIPGLVGSLNIISTKTK